MKRYFAFALAVLFAAMLLPHNAIASSYSTVIFNSNAYYKNGLINVDITISPDSRAASGALVLKYDSNLLKYSKYAKTAVNLGLVVVNAPDSSTGVPGEFRFSFANTEEIVDGGVIMTISFSHLKAFDKTDFELSCLELVATDTTTQIPFKTFGCTFYYNEIVNPGSVVTFTTNAYYKNGLVNVDIVISENSQAASGVLVLLFNDEVLDYTKHTLTAISLGLVTANPPNSSTGTPGEFKFGFANTEAIIQGGTIMTVSFSIAKQFDVVAFDLLCNELIMEDTYTELNVKTYGCTFESQAAQTHTVRFLDYDGKLLAKVTVEHGQDATPPADPQRAGYAFIGWDGNYTNVTEDRDIYAMYRQLGDIQGDGKVNTGDATAILRYLVGTMQLDDASLKAADFNGDGKVNSGDVTAILKYMVNK